MEWYVLGHGAQMRPIATDVNVTHSGLSGVVCVSHIRWGSRLDEYIHLCKR